MTRYIGQASDTEVFQLNGTEEIKALLKSLPEKIGQKIERKAMKQATMEVEKEVRRLVPVKSGTLRNSIHVTVRKKKNVFIGSVSAGGGEAYYARFIEYGWVHKGHKIVQRVRGRRGKYRFRKVAIPTSRGHIPGQKFMRGAIASKAQSVINILTDSLKEFAEKEIAKAKAKR